MNQRTHKRGDSRSGSGPHMKCSNVKIFLISDGGRFFLRKGKIYSMHAVSYWCIINHVGLHFFLDSGEMWLKFVLFFWLPALPAFSLGQNQRFLVFDKCTNNYNYHDKQIWLMIGQKTAKCDMRVLRVPVTWFYVGFF